MSRRRFLRTLAGTAGYAKLSGLLAVASTAPSAYPFEEVSSAASRISWVHTAGKSAEKYLPEATGAGCAFLDYDNDGWMDIYLVNSGKTDFYNPPHPLRNALYRNNRDGTFTDVTEKAGVAGGGYGMGVAVGDYDNDGHPDILVTNFGRNILYHNNGDGTFTDVTKNAGLEAESFYASAAFLDYDRDGYLDLFITRYNAFTVPGNKKCYSFSGGREYCGPGDYPSLSSKLYHNDGHGHFLDVSQKAGIASSVGNGLGVVCADFDGDGWIDIYVANDKTSNHL